MTVREFESEVQISEARSCDTKPREHRHVVVACIQLKQTQPSIQLGGKNEHYAIDYGGEFYAYSEG